MALKLLQEYPDIELVIKILLSLNWELKLTLVLEAKRIGNKKLLLVLRQKASLSMILGSTYWMPYSGDD